MKKHLKQLISFSLALMIGFFSPLSVYATDEHPWQGGLGLQLYYNKDEIKQYINDTDFFWNYAALQAGATFVDHDFEKFMNNYEKMDEVIDGMGLYKDTFGNVQGVYLPEDFMAQLKELLDQYAKENEPYYMVNTLTLDDCAGNPYPNSNLAYYTAKNLLDDSPSGIIAFGFYYSKPTNMFFVDVGHDFTNVSPVIYNANNLFVQFYDNETWNLLNYSGYEVNLNSDSEAIKTAEEFKERADMTYQNQNIGKMFRVYPEGNTPAIYPYDCRNATGWLNLITKERRRIRVFNSFGDFQNYTLGKRHVYYTSKYYEYTPADISVSTKELEQGVKDLNTAMDKLLEQIDKDTPESEVENLLQQILDELKNSGSGGGGEGPGTDPGTGGGTVDMSTTNSWLEKIYNKVCEIFDKMTQKDTPEQDKDSVSENSIDLSPTNTILEGIRADINAFMEKLTPGDPPGQDSVSGNSIDLSGTNSILDSIKSSLDDIHKTLKKMDIWSSSGDDGEEDPTNDLADMLKKILDDPETGSQEVADSLSTSFADVASGLTKKFPFSIPWDIYGLFSVFANVPAPSPQARVMSVAYDDRGYMLSSDAMGYDIQTYADTPSTGGSASGAPYFELPIYVESFGINEVITVDLEGFTSLSTFSRTMFSLIFGILLIKWTIAFIGAINEVMPDFLND